MRWSGHEAGSAAGATAGTINRFVSVRGLLHFNVVAIAAIVIDGLRPKTRKAPP